MLEIGSQAPDFSLPDVNGKTVNLSDFRRKKVFLWFFPKASTPGCTLEGCSLRDEYARFQEKNIEIVGMSRDSPAKQAKFVEKHGFPYTMLCDEEGTTVEAYEAWGKKMFMGREHLGILRVSYLIDESGKIVRGWPKVKANSHALDVLADLGG